MCVSESEQALQKQEQLLASLGTELAHNKQKVVDYRNQCQILRQDLKLANKVSHIASEKSVGDYNNHAHI